MVNDEHLSPDESTPQTPSPPDDWKSRLRSMVRFRFEPEQLAALAHRTVRGQNAAFYGKVLTILLSAYFVSDLTALVAGGFIPEPPAQRYARSFETGGRAKMLDDYNVIFARNLFNSKGLIPGEESLPGQPTDLGGPPVKTSLPINLIGTLILHNELESIATIQDKTLGTVFPVRAQDEIPGKMKIVKVEPRRMIFVNLASGRREYVELPEEKGNAPRINLGTPSRASEGIERVSETQFNIPRSEVDRALSNFNEILTQARAVPNFENGLPAGYKLFQIVPGSIYDKLGLHNGDVVTGFNGQTVNDPAKAFEMLNELRSGGTKHLDLQVKRDGRAQTFSYDIGG